MSNEFLKDEAVKEILSKLEYLCLIQKDKEEVIDEVRSIIYSWKWEALKMAKSKSRDFQRGQIIERAVQAADGVIIEASNFYEDVDYLTIRVAEEMLRKVSIALRTELDRRKIQRKEDDE